MALGPCYWRRVERLFYLCAENSKLFFRCRGAAILHRFTPRFACTIAARALSLWL